MKKYFGTDGIRGAVGEYPIMPDFMLKLGWATGKVFAEVNSQHQTYRNKSKLPMPWHQLFFGW